MNAPYKIMLVDDHQVIIDGLKILLPIVINCEIIETALSGQEAVDKVKTKYQNGIVPDVIIMDLVMPGSLNGIEATKAIKSVYPKIKILCLSMMSDASSIEAMLRAGANGYTVKNTTGEELKEAIESMFNGEVYIHPTLLKFFIEGVRVGSVKKSMIIKEIDLVILQSIAKGMRTRDIAQLVFRSDETIRSRRKQMLKRFSVTNSAELVAYAIRNRLIE